MLDVLDNWCTKWGLKINVNRTKIVHFRKPSTAKTNVLFRCGEDESNVVEQYKYLGLILSEHLDFAITSKAVVQSAGRALGLIIAKSKVLGGMPFECFSKLYNALVVPIFSYGAASWGTKEFSHVNAIHNRACRFYLGLGKSAPEAALQGDMGWPKPISHQWVSVSRMWCRLGKMPETRINRRFFMYCAQMARTRCQNWCFPVTKFFLRPRYAPLV